VRARHPTLRRRAARRRLIPVPPRWRPPGAVDAAGAEAEAAGEPAVAVVAAAAAVVAAVVAREEEVAARAVAETARPVWRPRATTGSSSMLTEST